MRAEQAPNAINASRLPIIDYGTNKPGLMLTNVKEIHEQIHYWGRRVAAFENVMQQDHAAALADFSAP